MQVNKLCERLLRYGKSELETFESDLSSSRFIIRRDNPRSKRSMVRISKPPKFSMYGRMVTRSGNAGSWRHISFVSPLNQRMLCEFSSHRPAFLKACDRIAPANQSSVVAPSM